MRGSIKISSENEQISYNIRIRGFSHQPSIWGIHCQSARSKPAVRRRHQVPERQRMWRLHPHYPHLKLLPNLRSMHFVEEYVPAPRQTAYVLHGTCSHDGTTR